MTTKFPHENVNITPDGDGKQAGSQSSPRSRKCLVLSPRRAAQSPLADRGNLPSALRTPRRDKSQCSDSPDYSVHGLSSELESQRLSDEEIPSLIPKTPQPELRRVAHPKKQISTPTIKISRESSGIEKPKFKEDSQPSPDPPSFTTASFYSSGSRTPQSLSSSISVSVSRSSKSVKSRRGSERGTMSRHRAKSAGGVKRKRFGLGFGGGHAIKKPKLTPKPEKTVKISDLPVGATVDLPAYSSSYKTSKTPAKIPAKTSGQLSMSGSTKVEFEVKAGQFVFRARPKTANTVKTPVRTLRRSPRKHVMSPLKADYFSCADGKRGKSRERNKLFSPTGNYMSPSSSSEEVSVLPSPVKFETGETGKTGVEMSALISSLAQEQDIEVKDQDEAAACNPELPDVSSAVNNILNDLSSGDESVESLPYISCESDDSKAEEESGETKLFPIFYKAPLLPSTGPSAPAGSSRRFVCSSLAESQTMLDAGQKVLGAVQCSTCGAVYTAGDPQEEEGHDRIHQGRLDTLKFPGWRTERKVGDFPAGRVICVKPGDHAAHWNKVTEILTVVDTDLGFSEVGIRWPDKTKVFLYIAEKKVVGLLLAEMIDNGFRILPNNGMKYTWQLLKHLLAVFFS